ncbi:MAG: hypothetical protein ABIJ09_15860 [Pseudomonadota bacterium]
MMLPALATALCLVFAADVTPASQPAPARGPVVVLADRDTRAYKEARAGIEAAAGRPVLLVNSSETERWHQLQRSHGDATWLALGPRATALLKSSPHPRRAALLVQQQEIPPGLAAVPLELPYAQQVAWLKTGFPGRLRLVVLRQPGGPVDDEALRQAAQAAELDLVLVDVRRSGDAVPALEGALRDRRHSSLLWVLPDPVAVSTDTVAPLVQAALAARVPVVGFSDYFLRVGALGAVVVDYRAVGSQAYGMARDLATSTQAAASAHLEVDGRLAERLGIAVDSGPGVQVRR